MTESAETPTPRRGGMKLLDTMKKTVKRFVPPSLLPEPKVAAAMASSGAVWLVAWGLGKKGYKVPKKSIQTVITAAVGLSASIPPVVAYMKASPKTARAATP
jgi:hypothetical protein